MTIQKNESEHVFTEAEKKEIHYAKFHDPSGKKFYKNLEEAIKADDYPFIPVQPLDNPPQSKKSSVIFEW